MIKLIILVADGERVYTIQSPKIEEIREFHKRYSHYEDEIELTVDGKEVYYPEIDKILKG